jgi:voltage-gated potassium channel
MLVPGVVFAVTQVIGTVGFYLSWRQYDGTVFDAVFMTFITVTTIGFSEIHPLDTFGRLVAMVVAGGGIGSLFYAFSVVFDYVAIEGRGTRRRRRMQNQIDALKDHFIVAGLGRVGTEAAAEFTEAGLTWVLVDPDKEVVARAHERGQLAVHGDASDDQVLLNAGVQRAKGMIVTTASDMTNLYVVLTARLLNPQLYIVARTADESIGPKMVRAGANRAISPYAIGGRRLAHLMLSPRAVDFFEMALRSGHKALNITDVVVLAKTVAAGKTLAELQVPQRSGATVLAVLREGQPVATPKGDLKLDVGDHLLALGTNEQLEKLQALLTS